MLEDHESVEFKAALETIVKFRNRVESCLNEMHAANERNPLPNSKWGERGHKVPIQRCTTIVELCDELIERSTDNNTASLSSLCFFLWTIRAERCEADDAIGASMIIDVLYDIMPQSDTIGIGIPT